MTFDEFLRLADPRDLSAALQALWHDRRDNWELAHRIVMDADDEEDCAWVHAYLHRKEGDLPNAGYWYRRANRPTAAEPLDREWESIARALLKPAPPSSA